MMNKDMFNKLKDEGPLTAEEALALDEALEADASEQIALMIAAQHDDAPSLAWRSELNQKLTKETRKGRRTVLWGLGAAVTTGAVAATFMLMMLNKPIIPNDPQPIATASASTNADSLEDTMLNDHEDAMNQASLGVYASFEDGSGF